MGQIFFTNNGAWRMTTSKQFDHLNRLTQISSVPSASSSVSFAYSYNDANQRISTALSDGSQWVYQYDPLGQVVSGKRYWADQTPVAGQQFEYGFDDIGNRTQTKAGGDQNSTGLRSASYGANMLNQYTNRTVPGAADVMGAALASASVTVTGADGLNNAASVYRKGEYFRKELLLDNTNGPLWEPITVSATGQSSVTGNVFLQQTPEPFTYDGDGNLTGDGRWLYTWDGEGRLVGMEPPWYLTLPDGAKRKLDFTYDYQGRRIGKTVSIWTNSDWMLVLSNHFLYDGWNLVAELNATNNAVIRSYLWGSDLSGTAQGAGGVGGLLAETYHCGAQTTNCLVIFDGNGNVSALINAADGSTVAQYEYGPFGELLRATGPMAKANPFRFSTKYHDGETDLLYYGYRYYSASTGNWLSRDPIEEEGGLNLYAASGNDAVNLYDLMGLWGNGTRGGGGTEKGHSDFVGSIYLKGVEAGPFDYTVEDDSWTHGTQNLAQNVIGVVTAFGTLGHGGLERHFRRLEKSEPLVVRDIKHCDLDGFQHHVHQVQDFFSHYGQGSRWWMLGHAGQSVGGSAARLGGFSTPLPDNPNDYKDAYNAASQRTYYWVARWKKCCTKCGSRWQSIPGRPEGECSAPPPKNTWGTHAPPATPRPGWWQRAK